MAIYTPEAPPAVPKPTITALTGVIRYGEPLEIQGTGFRGISEAFPLIRLRNAAGDRMWWLTSAPISNFADDPMVLQVVDLPPGLVPGSYLVSVVVAGVPSEPVAVQLECSVGDPVLTAEAIPGPAVTFRARSQGALYYRWRKDGVPIAGANAASYTTPPLIAADQGSVYTVEVDSSCRRKSAQATVTLPDDEAPAVANISPRGGEYWLLSPPNRPDEDKNREVVSWSMSDNLRICKVAVRLVYSTDGGATYQRIAGPALWSEGTAGACTFGHEAATTSFEYKIPSEPPGAPGALYKIEVEVTDYDTDPGRNDDVPTTPCQSPARADGARTTIACSANPFFIVQSNPDSVRTLILTHSARMERFFPGTRQELATGLRNLANHPRVQGFVVDLANATGLGPLYDAWDAAPADPAKANEVLFGDSGLHDYLREEIFPKLTGVRYLVLVGDDRIIPFARVPDGTALSESSYVDVPGGDLTSQSTVGKALSAGLYLSDDLLAVRPVKPPFSEKQIREGAFLPDLAAGRLVETPEEIIATIARFISKDGLLDLSALGEQGHKVLVTGYDFLIDAGRKVRQRWESALDQAGGGIAPVNGALLTPDWGESSVEDRRQALSHHLAGSGGAPYAIVNLNGHATHHQEGVPGTGAADIQGLSSEDLPDVEGTVIYGVGCHSGLSVPGSAAGDHPHDLPQAFLLRGALAYIANTGYGWGLETGIGYGERMVELFTEEMTAGGTVVVGDAVQRAKLRYFLQVPGAVNGYDEKTLLQWTLFGLPMYAVRTGIGAGSANASTERIAPATVERRLVSSPVTLPRFLTQLNLHFDFSAEGVYGKYDSLGNPIAGSGCPDPAGCYYTLNGVTGGGTGTTDLPIQPYFVYDSRLSGTSQHGALWTGGTYVE
ncbi:MAG TPA: C25 family cysteine peptidase, partial [Thermoanaerobaculia bacterium]